MSAPRFCSDCSGNITITFALVMGVLFTSAGAALDYSRASSARSSLQSALDAAAVAAAAAALVSDEDRIAAGQKFFKANFSLSNPPTPTFTIDAGIVTATAQYQLPTTIMGIAGVDQLTVGGSASATATTGPNCVLLLEKNENALGANAGSQLQAQCGIHANSANKEAIFANTNAKVSAAAVCVNGGYRENGGGSISPKPTTGCSPKPDPLATLPDPAEATAPCKFTDLVVQNGEIKTLEPGVYCKKLEINSGATANLSPGNYIFRDAVLNINANAKLYGDEVMLFFSGKDAYLNVNSGSTLQIRAPRTGTYKGILIFQSRDAITLKTNPFILNSGASTILEGSVYLPNGTITLNSQSSANSGASYTVVIARRMDLNSLGTFSLKANYDGLTPLPAQLANTFKYVASVRIIK